MWTTLLTALKREYKAHPVQSLFWMIVIPLASLIYYVLRQVGLHMYGK